VVTGLPLRVPITSSSVDLPFLFFHNSLTVPLPAQNLAISQIFVTADSLCRLQTASLDYDLDNRGSFCNRVTLTSGPMHAERLL